MSNHSKRARFGGRDLIMLFLGLSADSALYLIIFRSFAKHNLLDEILVAPLMNTDHLLDAVEDVHRDVSKRHTKPCEHAVQRQEVNTNFQTANFDVVYFVLVANQDRIAGHKLQFKWLGQQHISRVESDLIVECQNLLDETLSLVHAHRLKFYSDTKANIKQKLRYKIDHNEHYYNDVKLLLALRYNRRSRRYDVKAKWCGSKELELAWDSLQNLYEDISDMLERFLFSFHNKCLVQRAQDSLRRHAGREVWQTGVRFW